MILQQLRAIQAVIDHNMSVSRAADHLHTTQPAVSKLIRSLEAELGINLFIRRGNRLVGVTGAGKEAILLSRRVLSDTRAMANLAQSSVEANTGTLRVGTTHIHARYALVGVIRRFSAAFPGVKLELRQGAPSEIMRWVNENSVDLGISTLPPAMPEGIVTIDAYAIERCLIVPHGHPLLALRRVTIKDIAAYPQVTYDASYNSGWAVQREFQRCGLDPGVVVRATDANVIKAYVAAGLGVAVVQRMAIEPGRDTDLAVIDVEKIFPASRAVISLRADQFLRGYMHTFIRLVAPDWEEDADGHRAHAVAAPRRH